MWHARKRFGQHFLTDQQVLESIVLAILPQASDHLVEIGSGQGALTDYLLTRPTTLDLIEIDRDLVALLRKRYVSYPHVHIHEADVLHFSWEKLYEKYQTKLRVVGNLPYNISTPLLIYLLTQVNYLQDMHFLLQKEVAERLCAPVGDKHYSRLSVLTQFYCRPQLLFHVAPDAFLPPPKVYSAFVRLSLHQQYVSTPAMNAAFANLVKLAFAHRRKTLANNLKSIISAAMLSSIGINPQRRPQELTVAEYTKLNQYINQDILEGTKDDQL